MSAAVIDQIPQTKIRFDTNKESSSESLSGETVKKKSPPQPLPKPRWYLEQRAKGIAMPVSPEKVKEAAKYVYAHTFIELLPEKFDFKILGGGKNLSEGEGRLIVFARALAGESDLIVLDEATSSVDSVTENLIQKAIERIFHDKTVIAIAHRLSTIQNSDLILVIDAGKIVERGSHAELMQLSGVYASLLETLEKETELVSVPEK